MTLSSMSPRIIVKNTTVGVKRYTVLARELQGILLEIQLIEHILIL